MEITESVGWILLGFVPTFVTMEIGWKIAVAKKFKPKVEKVSTSVSH